MTERGRAVKAAKNRIVALQRENTALRTENDVLALRIADLKPRAIDAEDARELDELQETLSPKQPRETENQRVNRATSRKR